MQGNKQQARSQGLMDVLGKGNGRYALGIGGSEEEDYEMFGRRGKFLPLEDEDAAEQRLSVVSFENRSWRDAARAMNNAEVYKQEAAAEGGESDPFADYARKTVRDREGEYRSKWRTRKLSPPRDDPFSTSSASTSTARTYKEIMQETLLEKKQKVWFCAVLCAADVFCWMQEVAQKVKETKYANASKSLSAEERKEVCVACVSDVSDALCFFLILSLHGRCLYLHPHHHDHHLLHYLHHRLRRVHRVQCCVLWRCSRVAWLCPVLLWSLLLRGLCRCCARGCFCSASHSLCRAQKGRLQMRVCCSAATRTCATW